MAAPSSQAMARTTAGRSRREGDRWLNDSRVGCEVLLTYADGSTRKAIRARGWSDWLRDRIKAGDRNCVSVELVRPLNRAEYLEIREAHKGQRKLVLGTGPGPAPQGTPAPTAAPPRTTPVWELLVRRHGETRTVRAACATEDGALQLVMALPGVDAALVVRP